MAAVTMAFFAQIGDSFSVGVSFTDIVFLPLRKVKSPASSANMYNLVMVQKRTAKQQKPQRKAAEVDRETVPFDEALRRMVSAPPKHKTTKGTVRGRNKAN